jgi:hypothetical protein
MSSQVRVKLNCVNKTVQILKQFIFMLSTNIYFYKIVLHHETELILFILHFLATSLDHCDGPQGDHWSILKKKTLIILPKTFCRINIHHMVG